MAAAFRAPHIYPGGEAGQEIPHLVLVIQGGIDQAQQDVRSMADSLLLELLGMYDRIFDENDLARREGVRHESPQATLTVYKL